MAGQSDCAERYAVDGKRWERAARSRDSTLQRHRPVMRTRGITGEVGRSEYRNRPQPQAPTHVSLTMTCFMKMSPFVLDDGNPRGRIRVITKCGPLFDCDYAHPTAPAIRAGGTPHKFHNPLYIRRLHNTLSIRCRDSSLKYQDFMSKFQWLARDQRTNMPRRNCANSLFPRWMPSQFVPLDQLDGIVLLDVPKTRNGPFETWTI